jgi:hypothetical protein
MRDMPGDQETFSPVQKLVISEVLIAFIIVISLMAFFALYAQKPVVEQKEIQATVLNVDAFLVTEIDVQELLTGFGTVQADREVTLAAQVTGEIVEINPQLKVGYAVLAEDMVQSPNSPSRRQAAELLLKIDPRLYQQRLDQAKNQIAETETDIERLTIQESNLARQLKKSASVLTELCWTCSATKTQSFSWRVRSRQSLTRSPPSNNDYSLPSPKKTELLTTLQRPRSPRHLAEC